MSPLPDPAVANHRRGGRSPAPALLLGLIITLAAVVAYSWYITRQISGLRALQTDLVDRNRQDSLQLLRIQNDLHALGLAMRDMLEGDQPYPLTAWRAQFDRIRIDLDAALDRQEQVSLSTRTPEQRRYLTRSVAQFWDAADRIFALAREGREDEARAQIRLSLQARQASLTTAVARLLVENNAMEEEAAVRVQAIYGDVERQAYVFLGATLVAIVATSLYLIRANRRLFAELAALSDARRELAQKLISARESTLQQVARELHDELGQMLTAIGSMLVRAGAHAPEGSTLRGELREIGETAQVTLDRVRRLSQSLHPAVLDELGLESAIEWYLSTVERQTGIATTYERTGVEQPVETPVAIQTYRVLQEALANVARHAAATAVTVRLHITDASLELTVHDDGTGLAEPAGRRRGLGIVTMRERAELIGGTLEVSRSPDGGTLVRLAVPLDAPDHTMVLGAGQTETD